MDPETVQALRDTKGLYDEGILTEAEYKEKKAELLKPKPKAAPAPAAAPPRKKASEAGGAKKKKASEASDAAPAKKQKAADDGDAPAKKAKAGGKAAELVLQDSGAAGVLVTGGGTFRAKSLLSSLGGTWSKPLKAWVFAAGSAENVVSRCGSATAASLRKRNGYCVTLLRPYSSFDAITRRDPLSDGMSSAVDVAPSIVDVAARVVDAVARAPRVAATAQAPATAPQSRATGRRRRRGGGADEAASRATRGAAVDAAIPDAAAAPTSPCGVLDWAPEI